MDSYSDPPTLHVETEASFKALVDRDQSQKMDAFRAEEHLCQICYSEIKGEHFKVELANKYVIYDAIGRSMSRRPRRC